MSGSFFSLAKGLVYDNGSLVSPFSGFHDIGLYLERVETQASDLVFQSIYAHPGLKSMIMDSRLAVPLTFSIAMLAMHCMDYMRRDDVNEKSVVGGFFSLGSRPTSLPREGLSKPPSKSRQRQRVMTGGLHSLAATIGRSVAASVYVRVPFGMIVPLFITAVMVVFQQFCVIVALSYSRPEDNILASYQAAKELVLPIEVTVCFLFAHKVATSVYELHDSLSLLSGLASASAYFIVRRGLRNTWTLFGSGMVLVLYVLISAVFAYDGNVMRDAILPRLFCLPAYIYERQCYPNARPTPALSLPGGSKQARRRGKSGEGEKKAMARYQKKMSEYKKFQGQLGAELCQLILSKIYTTVQCNGLALLALAAGHVASSSSVSAALVESAQMLGAMAGCVCGALRRVVGAIVYRAFVFLSPDFLFTTGYMLIGWDGFLFPFVTREASSPVLAGTLYATRNETFLMVLTGAELVFSATDVCLNHTLHPLLGPQAPTDFFSSALNVTSFDLTIADSLYHLIHRYGPVHALFHSGCVIPCLYLGVMVYKFAMGFYNKQSEPEAQVPAKRSALCSWSLLAFETFTPLIVLVVVYLTQHVLLQALVFYCDPAVVDRQTMVRALYAKFTPLATMGESAVASSLAVLVYRLFRPSSYSFFFSTIYNVGFLLLRATLKDLMMGRGPDMALLISAKLSGAAALPTGLRFSLGLLGCILAASLLSALLSRVMNQSKMGARGGDKCQVGHPPIVQDGLVAVGMAVLFGGQSREGALGLVRSLFSALRYEFKYNVGYELANVGEAFAALDGAISEFSPLGNGFDALSLLVIELARLAAE